MNLGSKVRLINDINRVGIVVAGPQTHFGKIEYGIDIESRTRWIPADQLELIPSANLHPVQALLEFKFADINDIKRYITFIRLSGKLIDMIYSIETTKTDFYAHQYKPLVKLLNSPGKGLLIADEVGLGKTIEAGLIWTELKARENVKRCLVLCPAVLQKDKWPYELKNRFGIDSIVVDAGDALKYLKRSVNDAENESFILVCSMQGLRIKGEWDPENDDGNNYNASQKLAKFLYDQSDEKPILDLLIIDEAHYVRNSETKTSKIARLLNQVAEQTILLSATPIHIHNQDLFQLLNLLDEDTFNNQFSFNQIVESNIPLVNASSIVSQKQPDTELLSQNLTQALHSQLYQNDPRIEHLIQFVSNNDVSNNISSKLYVKQQIEEINILNTFISRTRKRDVFENRVIRDVETIPIKMNQFEKDFYDKTVDLLRNYCYRNDQLEGFLLVTPQRQIASSMPAALSSWINRRIEMEDYLNDDLEYDESNYEAVGPIIREIISNLQDLGDIETLKEYDSKYVTFKKLIKDIIDDRPTEKIVVFSYFVATLDYLAKRLIDDGYTIEILKGGLKEDKDVVISRFRENPINILLSSEIGSEGIDLQFSSMMINYDLPWNPMKVEQRIGRLDRIGQKSKKIIIKNLVYENTVEEKIYNRLDSRLHIIENVLGSFEPVIGAIVQDFIKKLVSFKLSPVEEQQLFDQTEMAIQQRTIEEDKLENDSAYLIGDGQSILQRITATKELKRMISQQELFSFVKNSFPKVFPKSSIELLNETEYVCSIQLDTEEKIVFEKYIKEQNIKKKTRLVSSASEKVKVVFKNIFYETSSIQHEIINQIHPIIKYIINKINFNSELSTTSCALTLSSSEIEKIINPGTYIFSMHKWEIQGLKIQEKISYVVEDLYNVQNELSEELSEKIIQNALEIGRNWFAARDLVSEKSLISKVLENCITKAEKTYDQFVVEQTVQNESRLHIQQTLLTNHFNSRLEKINNQIDRINQSTKSEDKKRKIIPALEGKIKKLKESYEYRISGIQTNRKTTHSSELIATGILYVTK